VVNAVIFGADAAAGRERRDNYLKESAHGGNPVRAVC